MTRQLTRMFRDGDRVSVTDTRDRHSTEVGAIEDWYFGMSGTVHYLVYLDGRQDLIPFAETQLAYEGEVENA